MFLFYADTDAAATSLLNKIPVAEFTNVRHKVARAVRTTVPDKYIARLYILQPLHKHIIECLNAEFTEKYTAGGRYVGYWPITVSALSCLKHIYIFMLLDEERDEILRLVREYEYTEDGFVCMRNIGI